MSIKKQSFVSGLLMLLIPFLVIGFSLSVNAETSRDYFKVGALTSLSGSLSKGGTMMKRGFDLWAEVVNDQGGILVNGKRYEVELVYRDAASSPADGAKAAETLITNENVDFILGGYGSMITLGAAPVIEKYQVPHIPGSTESDLIWQRHFDWTFQTTTPCSRSARTGVTALAKQEPKPETAAVITADDAFSISGAKAMRDEAEKHGIKVILYEVFPVNTTEFSSLISKVKNKNPDILLFSGHPEHHLPGLSVIQSLNFEPKGIDIHWLSSDIWRELEDASQYVMGTTMWTPKVPYEGPVFGTASEYAEMFEEKYGHEPDYSEAGASAGPVVFQHAIKEEGLTPPLSKEDQKTLRDAVEESDFETFFSPIEFSTDKDKYWHTNVGISLILLQIKDGEPVQVYPPKVAEEEIVYPIPKEE